LSSSFVLVTSSPSQHDPCAEINSLMPEGQHHRVNCRIKSTLFQSPCCAVPQISSDLKRLSVHNTLMNRIYSKPSNRRHSIGTVVYLSLACQQKYRNEPHSVPLASAVPSRAARWIDPTSLQPNIQLSLQVRFPKLIPKRLIVGTSLLTSRTNYVLCNVWPLWLW